MSRWPGGPSDSLTVAFEGRAVGDVTRSSGGDLSFGYAEEWLADGFAISLSMPLREARFSTEAQLFFANLLPEGVIRQLIARRLGVSEDNDWEMLAALGGDCAGALTLTEGEPPDATPAYRELSFEELESIAATPHPGLAAIAGGEEIRLSLAGAQDKLPVRRRDDGGYQLPLGTAPSTHIIKFANPDFAHLTANEVFVTLLARQLTVPVVDVALDTSIDPPLCVVARYDRSVAADGTVRRIHQEDLCQALAFPHTRKYEAEGGPDAARINAVLDAFVADPIGDARNLLRWLIFCVLAGNADGHAKNLSLLHDGLAPNLAPFYDLVCTRVYRTINRRLAISVAGAADPGHVARADWLRLGEQLDVRPGYVVELVDEMVTSGPAALEATQDTFRDAYGDLPVLEMVPPAIVRQMRRTRDLLAAPA